jgi:hypothetical protein
VEGSKDPGGIECREHHICVPIAKVIPNNIGENAIKHLRKGLAVPASSKKSHF